MSINFNGFAALADDGVSTVAGDMCRVCGGWRRLRIVHPVQELPMGTGPLGRESLLADDFERMYKLAGLDIIKALELKRNRRKKCA